MELVRFCFLGCLVGSALATISNFTDELLDVRITRPENDVPADIKSTSDKCVVQLHSSLEKLRRRQPSSKVSSLIDLSGYALHQPLRNAPVDMYVTDIKVKAPSVGSWVQVQRCQFSRNAEMSTQLLFNDLIVSGVVRLLPGNAPFHNPISPPQELCTMSLRLRRAGLDLRASPAIGIGGLKSEEKGRGIQVRTESNFVDPHFLSVHAYGCRLDHWTKEDGSFIIPNYPDNGERGARDFRSQFRTVDDPSVRIISLGDAPDLDNSMDDEIYRERILEQNREKFTAVLKVKNQIAQQTNAVFQAHGPFSQQAAAVNPIKIKPLFTPYQPSNSPTSTITELDDTLRPIRPVKPKPFQSTQHSPSLNAPSYTGQQTSLQDVSSEMEDVFLRGVKALLGKYLEKQLEIPIKEALMTKIGYTVSYG